MKLTPTWRNRLQNLTTIFLVLTVVAIIYTLIQWNRREFGSFEPLNALFLAVFPVLSWFSKLLSHPDNVQPPASSEIALAETPAFGPLRQQITNLFSLEEIRVLCLDVGIRYDALSGDTIDTKAASLLAYADRRGQLNKLIVALQQERPHVKWPVPNMLQTLYDLRRNVRATWIDGVLKQSVTDEIALELNLTLEPHALTRKVTYVPGQVDRPITKEVPQLFADFGSLLILGEPGSGKTMTLLQLAERLLKEVEKDANLPTPVVLNLSSWANEQKPLAEWLVEELWQQYQLSRVAGRAIIQNNQLIYLLDGLDEVAQGVRNACVKVINSFAEKHNGRLSVCCRVEEYEALFHRLNLGMGVRIQPLVSTQVEAYFQRPELELEAIYSLWKTDRALQKLAQTPLFLSVITLAYRGLGREELNQLNTAAAWQKHLYNHYVAEMFKHRPLQKNEFYDVDEALMRLSHLAYGMTQHGLSLFYLERLQPTWLPTIRMQNIFYRLNNMIFGASLGLYGGLVLSLIFAQIYLLFYWVQFPLYFSLAGGLIGGLSSRKDTIKLYEALRWAPQRYTLVRELERGLGYGLSLAPAAWLALGLDGMGARLWTKFGLVIGLILGLIGGREAYFHVQEHLKSTLPNQGIRSSLQSGIFMGLFYGLFFGLIFVLSLGLYGGLMFGLVAGLIGGAIFGVVLGLSNYGGLSFIQHYLLRFLLARTNIFPFSVKTDREFVGFLDSMKDRILLRRVGGGWMFIHRTLLEYFASVHPNAQAEVENV